MRCYRFFFYGYELVGVAQTRDNLMRISLEGKDTGLA